LTDRLRNAKLYLCTSALRSTQKNCNLRSIFSVAPSGYWSLYPAMLHANAAMLQDHAHPLFSSLLLPPPHCASATALPKDLGIFLLVLSPHPGSGSSAALLNEPLSLDRSHHAHVLLWCSEGELMVQQPSGGPRLWPLLRRGGCTPCAGA
jgi:hypothetical protein